MKSTNVLLFLLIAVSSQAQIGIGTVSPDTTAVLDIHSDNKGLLIPRVEDHQVLNNSASGLMVVNKNDHNFYQYNQEINSWQAVFPRGGIIMWSGSIEDIPDGWVLCNGEDERTPDLSGRFIVAYSGSGDYNAVGNTGGANSVTLSTAQMPSHSHSIQSSSHSHTGTTDSDGGHSHDYSDYLAFENVPEGATNGEYASDKNHGKGDRKIRYGRSITKTTAAQGHHNHSFTTSSEPHDHTAENTGGGRAHENRPSYYVLAFIMKL